MVGPLLCRSVMRCHQWGISPCSSPPPLFLGKQKVLLFFLLVFFGFIFLSVVQGLEPKTTFASFDDIGLLREPSSPKTKTDRGLTLVEYHHPQDTQGLSSPAHLILLLLLLLTCRSSNHIRPSL